MDMMEFFMTMGVKTDHFFKKAERCNCVFTTLRIHGNGIDMIAGSSYSYCCDDCFARMDEKEYEAKNNKFMEEVERIPRNKFMKTEGELEAFFIRNGLDKEKMRSNSDFFDEKIKHIILDKIEINEEKDGEPEVTFHLNDSTKK